jgi:hypothetical protein
VAVFLLQARATVTGSSVGSPTTTMAPTGAMHHYESPWTVGLSWKAALRCDGELGWQPGFGRDFMNSRIIDTLYIGKMT